MKFLQFKWLFSILSFTPLNLCSQNAHIKQGGRFDIMFYRQNILQNQDIVVLKQGENTSIPIFPMGEIFENAYPDYTAVVLFPNDTITWIRNGKENKFSIKNDTQRNNDFNFLVSLTQKVGPLNNSNAFEESLPLIDIKKTWQERDKYYYSKYKKHLPVPPKSNFERDSLLYKMYLSRKAYLNLYSQNVKLSIRFTKFFEKYIFYKYLSSSLNGFSRTEPDGILPPNLKTQLENTDALFTDSLININVYRHFLLVFNNYVAVLKNSSKDKLNEKLLTADSLYVGGSKNFVLFALVKNYLKQRQGIAVDSSYINLFMKLCKNDLYKNEILEILDNSKKISDSKSELISFDSKKISFNDLINLSKAKNKIFYIDFWASWCIPCLSEMSYSKKLSESLNNANIEFLYFSLDRSVSSWLSKQKELEAVLTPQNSYLVAGDFNSKLAKELKIKMIPRYIIIDSQGKVINDNVPRPSDPKLKILIGRLLNQ
ncbi:MAG: TlpA family protein disulfide reductase [Chitinophagaceae bacterium]|nr:TlpA family protein disulfide reductase [Chitinophagaceae bacterium]